MPASRRPRWLARMSAAVAIAGVGMLALSSIASLRQEVGYLPGRAIAANTPGAKASRPVRVRVPSADIDLPVISSERKVPGNTPGDTPCDVALYWTRYDLPGTAGTTWIYAHAQKGMFLPLFTISEATGGTGLIGDRIELQLRDGRSLTYRITHVVERAFSETIATRGRGPREQRLVLQTSIGPKGTIPKLQVSGTLIETGTMSEEAPRPRPRPCSRTVSGEPSEREADRTGSAAVARLGATEPAEPIDVMSLLLGGGAVLMGAILVAVWLVRRQA